MNIFRSLERLERQKSSNFWLVTSFVALIFNFSLSMVTHQNDSMSIPTKEPIELRFAGKQALVISGGQVLDRFKSKKETKKNLICFFILL